MACKFDNRLTAGCRQCVVNVNEVVDAVVGRGVRDGGMDVTLEGDMDVWKLCKN